MQNMPLVRQLQLDGTLQHIAHFFAHVLNLAITGLPGVKNMNVRLKQSTALRQDKPFQRNPLSRNDGTLSCVKDRSGVRRCLTG